MKLSSLEKFLLIAHDPYKQKFVTSELYLNYGIIGAMILQLSDQGKIEIEKNVILMKGTVDRAEPIFHEIAERIRFAKKPRKVKYWVSKLARKSKTYKWTTLEQLQVKNILRITDHRFLGLFPYRKSQITNTKIRQEIIAQLRHDALKEVEVSEENAILLGLIEACRMHKILSRDRQELKKIKGRLKRIMKDSKIASSVDATTREVQMAIIASVAASNVAIMAATTSS